MVLFMTPYYSTHCSNTIFASRSRLCMYNAETPRQLAPCSHCNRLR